MNCCIKGCNHVTNNGVPRPLPLRQKIPRPPNAFMLYANEHRKTMAHLYPADSNKEISRRLGHTWKSLNLQERNKYFDRAKDVDLEHKRKYPDYIYNPKDARMRKAIRSTLRDRSIGASPILPRPYARKGQLENAAEFYRNLIMTNPLARFEKQSPMWNGLCEWSAPSVQSNFSETSIPNEPENSETKDVAYEVPAAPSTVNVTPIESSVEERTLFEREKTNLEAAENYIEPPNYEALIKSSYLPISTTKFIKDPELFTNNAQYHKEYIIKYFNHIPDYETYNVTTEDGMTFPYVTIPNLLVKRE